MRQREGGRDVAPSQLRQQLAGLGDLHAPQRELVLAHYMPYLAYAARQASSTRRVYYGLVVISVVTATTVPALLGLDLGRSADWVRWLAFALGLISALSTTAVNALKLGERYRHYRGLAEALKREGWLFLYLAGPYAGMARNAAVRRFVERIEDTRADEVAAFLATVAQPELGSPKEARATRRD